MARGRKRGGKKTMIDTAYSSHNMMTKKRGHKRGGKRRR